MTKAKQATKTKTKTVLNFDSSASKVDIVEEAEQIVAGYQRIDLTPMQHALQVMVDASVTYQCDVLGVKASGKLIINLDYIHARRTTVAGHFSSKGYTDPDGNMIKQIGINPYDIQNRTLADIFATIFHEVIHFLADIEDNKPILGIPKGQGDTSRQGRYHGKNFQSIATRLALLQWIADDKIGCITSISEQGVQFVAEQFPDLDIFKIGKVVEVSKAKKEMDTRLKCQQCDYADSIRPSLAKRIQSIPAFNQEYASKSVLGYQTVAEHCGMPMMQA